MPIAHVQTGSATSSATTVTLILPTNAQPGMIAIALVDSGHPDSEAPTTPTGWTLVTTLSGGGGTYGADTGPRRISVYLRELQAGDTAPTISIPAGTNSRVGGIITVVSKDADEVVRYAVASGEDTTSGTAFSVTGSAIGWAPDDFVWLGYVVSSDAASFTNQAISAAGITFDTVTERTDAASTVGADAGRSIATTSVTAGTATAAPTISATLAAAATGVAAVLRLRPVTQDTGPATLTATYDASGSRVELAATGLDGNSTLATLERSTNNGITWTPVRGGVDLPITAGAVTLDDYEFTSGVSNVYRVRAYNTGRVVSDYETASATPVLTTAWLKSTMRAFLNQPVQLGGVPVSPQTTGRGHDVEIVGRTLPVGVVEVGGSARYDLRIRTTTSAQAQTLRYALDSGDVLFLHGPPGSGATPRGAYLLVRHVVQVPLRHGGDVQHWYVQVREVAAPGPDITTATATWATVLATYATWADVLAAHPTWADLLTLVGDPSEVIVP